MAGNKGIFPDWASLSINGVKHEDRLNFEKEVREDIESASKDLFGIKAGQSITLQTEMSPFDQEQFEKAISALRQMQQDLITNVVADYERPLLAAAIKKRLADGLTVGGFSLGVYQNEDCESSVRFIRHRFVLIKGGEKIKLIDFNINVIHDGVHIEHMSHVGELKL